MHALESNNSKEIYDKCYSNISDVDICKNGIDVTEEEKVSSAMDPKLVKEMLVLSTGYAGSYAYITNKSINHEISADKTSVFYEWSFDIYANIGGKRIFVKHFSDSKTLKV